MLGSRFLARSAGTPCKWYEETGLGWWVETSSLAESRTLIKAACEWSVADGVVAVLDLGLPGSLLRDLARGEIRCASPSLPVDPARTSSCCRFKASSSTVTPVGWLSSFKGGSESCPASFSVNFCAIGCGIFVPIFNVIRGGSGSPSTCTGSGTSFLASATRRRKHS